MSGSTTNRRRGFRRLVLLAPMGVIPAMMFDASVSAGQEDMVDLCHATASESNPFVAITVAPAAAFNGHLGAGHQNGEDIIQPFEYQGQMYSQNWDEAGMAIFENGCVVPASTTAAPTTAAPPTTAPPTTTPPTTMAPPTTVAGSTTTTGDSTSTSATPTTGDAPATTAGPTTTRPSTLPATGGGPDSNVVGVAVLLVLGGGVALAAARRRTA